MSLPEFVKKLLVLGQLKWEDGAFFVGGERSVIFRAGILAGLQERLEHNLGYSSTVKLMKALGDEQARSAFKRYFKSGVGMKTIPGQEIISEDPMIKTGRMFLETAGWGKFEYLWFKEKRRSIVNVKNSPIAAAYSERWGRQGKPVCHYLAGMLEGSAEVLLGKKPVYTEKTCAAQGHQYCVFEGKFQP